jgi:hypothetical protein
VSGIALSPGGRNLVKAPEVWILYPLDPTPSRRWVILAWVVMGLAGIFIQLRFTGRIKPKIKKARRARTRTKVQTV